MTAVSSRSREWRSPVISTLVVFIGLRMGDALSLLNNIVLGRWLDPVEFGQANALLKALSIPAIAMGVMICREAVWLTETQTRDALLRHAWRWFLVLTCIGMGCGLLVVVLGSVFQVVFKFSHQSVCYAIAATVAVTIMSPLWGSVLQGQRQFVLLGIVPSLQGTVRIAATMVLIYMGFHLVGAMVAPTLAMLAAMVWCIYWVHRAPGSALAQPPAGTVSLVRPPLLTMFLNDLIPLTALTILLSTDVIVVNYLLPADTGGYAAVSTIGQITFYVPQGIVITLLPYVMRDSIQGRTSRWYLLMSAAATGLVSGVIIWLLYQWHSQIMHLYNPVFVRHAGYLPRYTVAMGLFSIVTITTNYAMARGIRRIGCYLVALVPVQLILYYFSHGSLQSLIDRTVMIAFLALVGSLVLLVVHRTPKMPI